MSWPIWISIVYKIILSKSKEMRLKSVYSPFSIDCNEPQPYWDRTVYACSVEYVYKINYCLSFVSLNWKSKKWWRWFALPYQLWWNWRCANSSSLLNIILPAIGTQIDQAKILISMADTLFQQRHHGIKCSDPSLLCHAINLHKRSIWRGPKITAHAFRLKQ